MFDQGSGLDESSFFEIFSATPSKGDNSSGDYINPQCPYNYQIPLKDIRDFTW